MLVKKPYISVVVPVFNESSNLDKLVSHLIPILQQIHTDFEIIVVDDGSTDDSVVVTRQLIFRHPQIKCICLSRNFGHQIALMAGLSNSKGELIVMMDADLQHPPHLIQEMYEKYQSGYDVVNTIRKDDASIGFLKKRTSSLFYFFINKLSSTHIQRSSTDFRLVTRRFLGEFLRLSEKNRFNRGLIQWLGFNQFFLEYKGDERHSGSSKYSYRKMFSLAIDAITSFSSKPLRMVLYIGFMVVFLGIIYASYAIYKYINNEVIEGWTSILISILILGGIQILSIGVIGEYLSKVFNEVKNRPLYIVKEIIESED